jgi:predicted GNAT superfamily acetyltransferase
VPDRKSSCRACSVGSADVNILLRAPLPVELPSILALNNAHAAELGALSPEALAQLVTASFRTRVTGAADAFIIALEQGANYDSPNYRWFSERFTRFAYIDRVAVAVSARKRGIARAFYLDLIEAALRADHVVLACEVNSDPPNPVSDAFHASLGFQEIGRARISERNKSVRYLVRPLASD